MRTDTDHIGPPLWNDRPVILVGGGPSLFGFDLNSLSALHARVVGINRAMFDAPCHAGLSADHHFVNNHRAALAALAKKIEITLAIIGSCETVDGAVNVHRRIAGGFSHNDTTLNCGGSSGSCSVGLAFIKQARTIILLGFDYGFDGARHHYHDAYTDPMLNLKSWQRWAHAYATMTDALSSAGVTVINASPNSAIGAFPKCSIKEALARCSPCSSPASGVSVITASNGHSFEPLPTEENSTAST